MIWYPASGIKQITYTSALNYFKNVMK